MQRRWVPAFMALVLLGVLAGVLLPRPAPGRVIALVLAIELGVAAAYAALFSALVAPTAESVVLDGDTLRVRRKGREAAIPVSHIKHLRGSFGINPETITFELHADSAVGRSVTFIPPARFPSVREHPVLTQLRQMFQDLGKRVE